MVRSITFALLIITAVVHGQKGYKIEMKIKGLKDTTAYLGLYYGESTRVSDTAKINGKGEFFFAGTKPLAQGVYFLVLDKTRIFDFVVGEDQTFSMETKIEDYTKNMKITGDEDNRLFFEYMAFYMARKQDADPFVKILKDSSLRAEQKKPAQEELKKINQQMVTHQTEIINKNPQTLTARILKSTKEIEIPDPPKNKNGSIDSSFRFNYYKAHYWDNFNLADDALIRMPRPFYQEKIKDYLTKLVIPVPDSLNKEIDRLAKIARKNKETYKYFIWMCVVEYQTTKIMGLDAVYVHLIDKYFNSGEMDFWINETMKRNLKNHADQLKLSLIGMTAPNLIMQDQNLMPRNMYDIKNKYTILFIFDPDCGLCREETPKLVNFYHTNKTKFDLEVFAVSADSSMQKMKKYIEEMKMPWITVNGPRSYLGNYQKFYDADQTPSMYVIDNKKKIIAKKPPIEELVNFLTHHENLLKRQKEASETKPSGK